MGISSESVGEISLETMGDIPRGLEGYPCEFLWISLTVLRDIPHGCQGMSLVGSGGVMVDCGVMPCSTFCVVCASAGYKSTHLDGNV